MADLRKLRTQREIQQALADLLLKKTFSKITVTDIVNKALINRNTFYLHYRNLNDVLNEVVAEVLARQSASITAEQFSQQPFNLFYQLWTNLTPTEHQILRHQQADPGFESIVIRMIMQQILIMYPDDSNVWFAFGKVTAIIAWMSVHHQNWHIDTDAQQLQMMYDQQKLV